MANPNYGYSPDKQERGEPGEPYDPFKNDPYRPDPPAPEPTTPEPTTPQTGPLNEQAILAWLQQNASLTGGLMGSQDAFAAYFPGATIISDDKIQLPGGQIIDVIVNFGGAGPSWGWGTSGGPGAGGGGGGGGMPGSFYEAPPPFEYPGFEPPA